MCVRNLGFIVLMWFPGVLHVQSEVQPCPAPSLNDGYIVPEKKSFNHGETLTYACDNGYKPAVEGWWAMITCLDGTWSHEPQCIDENMCTKPTIANAIYTQSPNGTYQHGDVIRTKCDEGFEHKDHNATAKCVDGKWSTLPVCERSFRACGAPPFIPHAVVILQEYKEVFVADSVVEYECEEGYKGEEDTLSVICISGIWTEGPTCQKAGSCGPLPEIPHARFHHQETTEVFPADSEVQYDCVVGYTAKEGDKLSITCMNGTWTEGPPCSRRRPVEGGAGGTQPASGGSRTQPAAGARNCRNPPLVLNGVAERTSERFVTYRCNRFFKLQGPRTVDCYSDGTWSDVPICKATFCSVNTDVNPELKSVGTKYLRDGETVKFECVKEAWWSDYYAVAECTDGTLEMSKCCNRIKIHTIFC